MHKFDAKAELILSDISNDRHSGARELVIRALEQLSTYGYTLKKQSAEEQKHRLKALAYDLSTLRPSMASLQNTLNDWLLALERIKTSNPIGFIEDVQALCTEQINGLNFKQEKLVNQAVEALSEAHSIMTISRSSTLVSVFKRLMQRPLTFIICESRPGNEGKQLATELAALDFSVEYIVDAAINNHINQVDAVVVGADTILFDGAVVNKCGTSLLALAANYSNRPFYVIADSSKFSRVARDELIIEEMEPHELEAPVSSRIKARNLYFDITDANLVTHYLTDKGINQDMQYNLRQTNRV